MSIAQDMLNVKVASKVIHLMIPICLKSVHAMHRKETRV